MIATNTPARKSALLACAALFFVQLSAAVPQLTTPPVVSSREMPAYVTNLATRLPLELVDLIFDLLLPTDVWTTQRVRKGWHNRFWRYGQSRREQLTEPKSAFGTSKWHKYYGLQVTDAPYVPAEILALLDQECCIWPGKKVAETHLLTLIPKGLTLNRLAELIQHPLNGGHSTEYLELTGYYEQYLGKGLGNQPVLASYWVLMTRHILPNSRSKSWNDQRLLVAEQAQRARVAYVMPRAIEAATCILTHFVQHGERMYGEEEGLYGRGEPMQGAVEQASQASLWTYIRCEEKVDNNQFAVVVGGFSSIGLLIGLNHYPPNNHTGVSAVVRVEPVESGALEH